MSHHDEPALRRATSHFVDTHPEEATTLGVVGHDARWSARSPAALEARARAHRVHLEALEGGEGARDLDREMLVAHLRAETRRIEAGEPFANVEAGVLGHAVLRFQALHARTEEAWEAVAARAGLLAESLAEQEALLERGLASGRPADAVLAQAVAAHECPLAADDLATLGGWPEALGQPAPRCRSALREAGERAAEAQRAHARFLVERVAARGAESFAIGAQEYATRLRLELGIERSPHELAAHHEARLPELEAELLRSARVCAEGRADRPSVETLDDARALVTTLYAETLEDGDDPLAIYDALVARAARFAVEQGIVNLPNGYALGIQPLPAHRLGHLSSTNWPAPPLDPKRKGHLLVSPRPSDHGRAFLEGLAVHEATPGHYLQSVAFQDRFAGSAHVPARLLGMTDELAMAQGFYGPMLAIEGWATRSTDVMRRFGFFCAEACVVEAASRIIHALRVVTDVGLHVGAMDRPEAARLLAERTGLPLRWAQGQALRYSRIPLQAITYGVGAEEIDALERSAREEEGDAFDLARFHDELLQMGPVPPAWLRSPTRAPIGER